MPGCWASTTVWPRNTPSGGGRGFGDDIPVATGQGVSPIRIAIGGDYCHGGLTVAALVALKYFGDPVQAASISRFGWANLAHTGADLLSGILTSILHRIS